MASLIEEKRNGRTLYRLQWRDKAKRRHKLRLGAIAKRDAQAIVQRVRSLLSSSLAGLDPSPAITEWLSDIGDDLHARLAERGLCKARAHATLGQWLEQFLAGHRRRVGRYAVANCERASSLLLEYFNASRPLRSLSEAEAQAFRDWLRDAKGFSQATISGHVKKARQFFLAAVKAGAITASPFAGVVAGSQVNDERSAYVPVETIEQAIAWAPDSQWRLIIALARFAGLRCPSELLRLRWADVDFSKGLLTIRQGKTKRRECPILPELRPFLLDAFEPEQDRCIHRYRVTNANLRKGFLLILAKAEIEPWPRLWHALRASLETDLVERFPIHAVTRWLGNSPAVATKHYLRVTEEHVALATSQGLGGRQVGPSLSETPSLASNERKAICEKPEKKLFPGLFVSDRTPPRGVEPLLPD